MKHVYIITGKPNRRGNRYVSENSYGLTSLKEAEEVMAQTERLMPSCKGKLTIITVWFT